VNVSRHDRGGIVERLRFNRLLVVAVVGRALLLIAWIAWAIHVTSDKGATAGLGVVIAWPALLAALALISLPFIGAFLAVRRLSAEESSASSAPSAPEADPSAEEPSGEDPSAEDFTDEEGCSGEEEEDSEDAAADEE
jgi:hypothetical protein